MELTQAKHEIETLAEKHRDEFETVSACIFAHPELAYHETLAQDQLCGLLEKHGFKVQRGAGSLETAFVAEYGVILKEIMEKYGIGGTLKVLGTPAEENGSGKITMLDEGIFDGVDMALIMHPSDMSMADDISFAAVNKTYTFTGKPAHTAACPWMGASALNGVLQMFHAVDSQRLHFKDYTRVHGIILEGGTVVNIVPEKAVCRFNIRALDAGYLEEVIAVIDRCAKGAAICAGVEVEIKQDGYLIKDVRNNRELVTAVEKNMDLIGEHHIPRDLTQGIGSTDVGNVTQALPAAQFYIGVGEGLGTHTAAFAEAAGGEAGRRALTAAVKVLAMTGLDMMSGRS